MHASIAVTKVYLTPRSQSASARLAGRAPASDRSTARSSVTDLSRRSSRTSSTTALALGELAVGTQHPRSLIEVHLAGGGDPPDASLWTASCCSTTTRLRASGQLQRGLVQHEQVDPRR